MKVPASTYSVVIDNRGAGGQSNLVGKTIGASARHGSGSDGVPLSLPALKAPLMNFISTGLLALAMSTDAFAAAVGKGTELNQPRWREALRTGAIFGVIEMMTPLAGWALGLGAANYVKAWDHWIAFTLLSALGARMVIGGFKSDKEDKAEKPESHSFWMLALTGFATSIDAMAVGVGLAFLDVQILPIAAAIGFATFVMVTLGVMLGRMLGSMAGKRAEILGGVVLAGIGLAILIEHLTTP